MAEIEVISVGIVANLAGLKSQLSQAKQLVVDQKFPERQVLIGARINQQSINAAKKQINDQLRGQMERNLEFKAKITASTTSIRTMMGDATKQLRAGEGIKIPIQADLKSAQALKKDIQSKISPINVELTWSWRDGPPTGGGGGGGGGVRPPTGGAGPGSSTVTAHEKAVNRHAAAETVNALTKAPTKARAKQAVTATTSAALMAGSAPVGGIGGIIDLINRAQQEAGTTGALSDKTLFELGAARKTLRETLIAPLTGSPRGAKRYASAVGAKRGGAHLSEKTLIGATSKNVLDKQLTALIYGTETKAAFKESLTRRLNEMEPEEQAGLIAPYVAQRAGTAYSATGRKIKAPTEEDIRAQGVKDFVSDFVKAFTGPTISYPQGIKKPSGVEEFVRGTSEFRARNRAISVRAASEAMSPEEKARASGPTPIPFAPAVPPWMQALQKQVAVQGLGFDPLNLARAPLHPGSRQSILDYGPMGAQGAMSIAEHLRSLKPGRRLAGGGEASSGMYLVGEKGPEILEMRGGGGYVHPLPGRAEGGSVGRMRDAAGRFVSPAQVQRVYVVNMPAAFGSAQAAGPFRVQPGDIDKILKNRPDLAAQLGVAGTEPLAAKAPAAERIARLSLEQQQVARQQARAGAVPLEARLTQAKANVAEAQQLIPVRSLSVAVGQIFSTIFGGRGDALTRAREANALTAKATSETSNWRAQRQKLLQVTAQLAAVDDPKKHAELIEQVQEQAKATRVARNSAEELTTQAEKASANIIKTGGALRNLAAGTVGVVTGTLLFGTAMGVAQAALTGLTEIAAPAIERLTGFQNVAGKVTGALADQTRAMGGAINAATAATEAQANLSAKSADAIDPLIKQRAAVEAGNKAFVDQIDLLHTFQALVGQGGPVKGFDKGLFQTTGGLFGTNIQGVPSTIEQLANEIGGLGNRPTTPTRTQFRGGFGAAQIVPNLDMAKNIEITTKTLADFNGQLEKGGSSARFVVQANEEQWRAIHDLAVPGSHEFADNLRKAGISLQNFNATSEGLAGVLQAFNQANQIPDPQVLIRQMTDRIIPAALAEVRANSLLQRKLIIPGQFALGEIAQPTPGTQGIPFGAGVVGKGDAAAAHLAQKYSSLVGGAVRDINEEIKQGQQALMDLVPPELQAEFGGLLKQIGTLGQQISKIQLGGQQEQVNLAVHEYNNQLRIARRSLADARDLQAALAGHTRDTLGGLEGQNIALQRELQLLGFALQQRQINYQVALAGFVAPGSTPGERAARIEEAKIEASYAQRQLDLQKQIAANQFKTVHIQVGREVTDLLNQLSLLQEGRRVTIDIAVRGRAIEILSKQQALLAQQAQAIINEGVQVKQQAISAAAEVVRQTGKGFASVLGQTAEAWGIFGKQAAAILNALTGTAPGSRNSGDRPLNTGPGHAAGYIGMVNSRTNMTVGEAGGEAVAILSHPRSVTGFGGGGGVNVGGITVIINGGGDSMGDTEAWANIIARKVEERLSRKIALLGTRTALGST